MRGGDGIAPRPTSRQLREATGRAGEVVGVDRPTPSPAHTHVEAIQWLDSPYQWH